MGRYLEKRTALRGLVLVMDIRHPLTDLDRQMVDWAITGKLPLLLLLTKADKLKRGAIDKTLHQVRREMAGIGVPVELLAFSATSRLGLEAVQAHLEGWLGLAEEKGNEQAGERTQGVV